MPRIHGVKERTTLAYTERGWEDERRVARLEQRGALEVIPVLRREVEVPVRRRRRWLSAAWAALVAVCRAWGGSAWR